MRSDVLVAFCDDIVAPTGQQQDVEQQALEGTSELVHLGRRSHVLAHGSEGADVVARVGKTEVGNPEEIIEYG